MRHILDINCIHHNKCPWAHTCSHVLIHPVPACFILHQVTSYQFTSILSPSCYCNCSLSIRPNENTPRAKDTSCTACKRFLPTPLQITQPFQITSFITWQPWKCKVFHEGVLLHSWASKQQPFHSFLFYDQYAALWNALKGKSINPLQGSITQATLQNMRTVVDQCSHVLPAICSSVSWSACKIQKEAINSMPNSKKTNKPKNKQKKKKHTILNSHTQFLLDSLKVRAAHLFKMLQTIFWAMTAAVTLRLTLHYRHFRAGELTILLSNLRESRNTVILQYWLHMAFKR